MMTRSKFAILSLGVLLAAVAIAPAPPREDRKVSEADRERIKVAQQGLVIAEALWNAGQDVEKPVILWSRRLVEATRKVEWDRGGLIVALEAHLDLMKKLESPLKTRFQRSEVQPLRYRDVQYSRLEAESWLEEARSK